MLVLSTGTGYNGTAFSVFPPVRHRPLFRAVGREETRKARDARGYSELALQDDGSTIGFKPLYAQVKDQLIRRLVDGTWQPGMNIPSEQELARQLSVSQGTVRKALDSMTSENLLVRRQGRGTFVAEPEDARILFQFFRITADGADDRGSFPDSKLLSCNAEKADADQTEALSLAEGADIWHIERVRTLLDKPLLTETIIIPADTFTGWDNLDEIPNNVYQLYSSRWGITIAKADEQLKAITASSSDAEHLGCEPGEPLLQIRRVACNLEGKPVELRVSRCLTRDMHYAANLP